MADGTLPSWDLGDLYPSPDSTVLEADLGRAMADAAAFQAAWTGKLAGADGFGLAAAIAEYERIEEVLGRVMSYAQLLFSGDFHRCRGGQILPVDDRAGHGHLQPPDLLHP